MLRPETEVERERRAGSVGTFELDFVSSAPHPYDEEVKVIGFVRSK